MGSNEIRVQKPQNKVKVKAWQNAASGALAGVISRFVIAPLDVVKIRFQLQSTPLPQSILPTPSTPVRYTSILQSLRLIVKEEGIRGLFKGNLSAEYLYLTYGAVQFLTFHECDRMLLEKFGDGGLLSDKPRKFVSGSIAGALATFLTYPFDLLRTRFAAQSSSNQIYSGIFSAVSQIHQQEGIQGFYRGCYPAILQIIPYMGIMFTSQAFMKQFLVKLNNNSRNSIALSGPGSTRGGVEDFISGGLAGMFSKTMVMPFDVIR